jgi:hypothetical protein
MVVMDEVAPFADPTIMDVVDEVVVAADTKIKNRQSPPTLLHQPRLPPKELPV